MPNFLTILLALAALVSPVYTAVTPKTSAEYAKGGALDEALASLADAYTMLKDEVMTQLDKLAWDDLIVAAKTTLALCREKGDLYLKGSNTEFAVYLKQVNLTYIVDEADKMLDLATEAKDVSAIFASQTGEEGVKLTRKQVKFLSSEFLKMYASVNWTAIDEFLVVAKTVAFDTATAAAENSGAAAKTVGAKTVEVASVAAAKAAPVVAAAKSKAGFLIADGAAPERPAGLPLSLPLALLAAAGVVAWRWRGRAAYGFAKAAGGEPAQPMI